MSKIIWHKPSDVWYETGVQDGVLYLQVDGAYPKGVAWNGLISVTESPSGAEANPLYADNIKYLNLMSAEDLEATVEAYTYPLEFTACLGETAVVPGVYIGQQKHQTFGMAYKTFFGNDTDGTDHGYKLHIIYGAMAAPSEKAYNTINDSPEATTFSWELTTTPVAVSGYKPTASLTIDPDKVNRFALDSLLSVLYGTNNEPPRLPLPEEIITLLSDI